MKLLLVNTNTTEAITELLLAQGRKVAAPTTRLTAVTGRFGGRYVASRATYAIAGHAALDAYARHGADADAVVLACFGDPGLEALREVASQPVVGMAEASCVAAAQTAGRFAIVTGGERWGPMLREFVASIGLADRLAVVHTLAPTGGDIARDPEGALRMLADACRQCIRDHGASSVILGGAGLAGLAERIADRVDAPVIDSLTASIRLAEARAAAALEANGHAQRRTLTPTETIGLGDELAALLRQSGP